MFRKPQRVEQKVEAVPGNHSREVIHMENKPLNGGLLNKYVRPTSTPLQMKMINGKYQIIQPTNNSNKNEMKKKQYYMHNKGVYGSETQEDPQSGLILKTRKENGKRNPRSEYNNNYNNYNNNNFVQNKWRTQPMRSLSVRSSQSRGVDTLQRHVIQGQMRPVHMYTRFQPSFSKYDQNLIRSSQPERNINAQRADNNTDRRFFQSKPDNRVFQSMPGMNNIYSFSNLNQKSNAGLIAQNSLDMNNDRADYNNLLDRNRRMNQDLRPQSRNYIPQRNKSAKSVEHLKRSAPQYHNYHHQENNKANYEAVIRRKSICNILVMLFRKMLVFNSKLEGLKQKLYSDSQGFQGFNIQTLFSNFCDRSHNKIFSSGLNSCFQHLGFNYSPAIVQKLIRYFSKMQTEHINMFSEKGTDHKFELTGSGKLKEVTRHRQNHAPRQYNEHQMPKQQDSLSFREFEGLFIPLKDNFTLQSEETLEKNIAGDTPGAYYPVNKEAEYHLIRQIVILSLRKLEDLGWMIRSLKIFRPMEVSKVLQTEFTINSSNQIIDETTTVKNGFAISDSLKESNFKKSEVINDRQNGMLEANLDMLPDSKMFSENSISGRETGQKGIRGQVLNQFSNYNKRVSEEMNTENLMNFLNRNEIDHLPSDLVFIFKEIGCDKERVSFNDILDYLALQLWNI